jgi:hypothetical protein
MILGTYLKPELMLQIWHDTELNTKEFLAISNVHSLPTPRFLSNSQIQGIVAHPILQRLLIT